MTLGYPLPADGTAATFYDGFEWELPERYDVAAQVLDERSDPDDVALHHVDGDDRHQRFTYAELAEAADATAAGLAEAGVERGDRVAVSLPTCPEQLAVHLGAYRLGAVVVPLSVLLGAETAGELLERTGPAVLVADESVADSLPERGLAAVDEIWRITPGSYAPPRAAAGGLNVDADEDGGPIERADPAAVDPAPLGPGDPALVMFTSGTTGAPKGVVAPHSYLAGSLPGYHCWFHVFSRATARDVRAWTPSEWAWAGALFDVVFPTLALGGTVVSRCRRSGFEPARALDLAADEGVTHAFLPPTALAKLRATGVPDGEESTAPDSLDVVMAGGESLTPALSEWAENALDVVVNHAYGQTEANATVGECRAAFEPEHDAMGKPYPGHELAVLDTDGDPCPPGHRGELVLELPDPVAFLRYWENPDETARVRRDGRLHTGDLAYWTEDGSLVHAGRVDDLIVTSGYRVDPLEVERVLADHPAVVACVVGGVPDEVRGERVKAVVRLADSTDRNSESEDGFREELTELVRERLGRYKVPREIEFVDELPQSRTGKTDRDAVL